MEHIAPLLQTILWVGLVGALVWRFHKPIDGILSALHRRIDGGSSLKAGWFELTDQLRPQDALQQREKAAQEIQEVLHGDSPVPPQPQVPSAIEPHVAANVQAKYFQAEDLVLRAIQAEYGATVKRQVTGGRDMGFDAAFTTNGRLNIVEVKYIRTAKSLSRMRETTERLASTIRRYHWDNVQIILAVVFEEPSQVTEGMKRLEEITAGIPVPVAIRCYGLEDLQRRFGVASESFQPQAAD